MTFDFAQAKASARRVVHATFGVQAFYQDASMNSPIETRARWHSRISKPYGDLNDGTGYSEVIEGIDRIVFIAEDINGFPFEVTRNGRFTFPSIPGVTFTLEYRDPTMGPPAQAWTVTKE